jgi:hypothetical protein
VNSIVNAVRQTAQLSQACAKSNTAPYAK